MSDVEIGRGLPETLRLPFETNNNHGITAFFKHMSVLNVAQSETQGKRVYDLREVVELRFSGDRNYVPVMPADSMWQKIGDREITYAERYAEQYRAFITGDDQKAGGTALEALADYGITPSQLSICRALRIYSVEALHSLDGPNLKNLGMSANQLKSMARRFMEDRGQKDISATNSEIEKLKAELERLKAAIPSQEEEPSDEEFESLIEKADAEFASMSDDQLKEYISEKAGSRPRGQPSRTTLIQMAKELAA